MSAKSFEAAARAYAARCDQISTINAQVRRLPGCEKNGGRKPGDWEDGDGGFKECPDFLVSPGSYDEAPSKTLWWEATQEQVDAFCAVCQSRIALWSERYRLRGTLPGLKTSLMRAFRREAGKAEGR